MTRQGAHVVDWFGAASVAADGQQQVVGAPRREGPLVSGDPTELWIGTGLLLLALLALTAVLMVWRVNGAKSRRKKRSAELFQPAGVDAEITFDDEQSAQPTKADHRERRKREKAERASSKSAAAIQSAPPHDGVINSDEAEVVIERSGPAQAPQPPAPKKSERRSGPLSGLFSPRKKAHAFVPGSLDIGADAPAADQARLHPLASERRKPRDEVRAGEPDHPVDEAAVEAPAQRRPIRAEAEEAHRLAGRLEEERRHDRVRLEAAEEIRRRAIDDARLVAEREQDEIELNRRAETARLQAEAEAREEARRRNYEREAEFERRKQLAAIEQRERELRRTETANDALRRDLTLELERKVEALAARMPERPVQPAQFADVPPTDPALLRAVERIARDLSSQRSALEEAFGTLSTRVEELGASARDGDGLRQDMAGLKRALNERFAGPSAPMMQLDDILRNALPPDAYDVRVTLSNNRKADCLVRLPDPPGPVAIDGRFPIESFQKLHVDEARDQAAAENEFRRSALRHIVDIAERLIIPGETSDCALLFLPSESMHTEFLVRFQDLVQDSYRARVWIVSPTTLMATLHTMRAVIRDDARRAAKAPTSDDAQSVLSEVEALRQRVMGLEQGFDRVRQDISAFLTAPDHAASAPTQTNPSAAFINIAPESEPAIGVATPPAETPHPHANGAAPPPLPGTLRSPQSEQRPDQSRPDPSRSDQPHQDRALAERAAMDRPTQAERPPPAFLLPPVPPVR